MIPLHELAQHWVRYKAWLYSSEPDSSFGYTPTFDNFMVWLMEDLSNETHPS